MDKQIKIKVAIVSSGVGHISRGFEISATEWFKSLLDSKLLAVKLFAGGKYPSAKTVFNIPRNSAMAGMLRKANFIKDGTRLEQISFGFGFLFQLLFYKPDVIWLQEEALGATLLRFRKLFGLKTKIVFCDGAPVGHKAANKFDYIIFLHTYAYQAAIEDGISSSKCTVIPYIRNFPAVITKQQARQQLNLPENKFIIISVAAWNKHHKRIHYLLQEVASLKDDTILLLLCGQPEKETGELKDFASSTSLSVLWWTLSQQELSVAYDAADLFILSSLNEGLPGVVIEAGAHRLPIICHPHAGGKFILGEDYKGLTDLSVQNNLAKKITEIRAASLIEFGEETGAIVSKEFSKEKLVKRLELFLQMVVSN